MKLLHIISTPRSQESNTLRVSTAFLNSLRARYGDLKVDEVDLFNQNLPAIAGDNIESKYTPTMGQPIDKRHKESWNQIELLIQNFLAADLYLISAPMWNFGIPYTLKYYIDSIIQPGYLYRYNEQGVPVPMVLGKKMVCITSRGGDYSANSPFHVYDFQEPYLRAIFGYVGIRDMHFINAQPMDISPALRQTATAAAIQDAVQLASSYDWADTQNAAVALNPAQLKPRPI